jgi:hypothetical protein
MKRMNGRSTVLCGALALSLSGCLAPDSSDDLDGPEPTDDLSEAAAEGTVEAAVSAGCSTSSVRGLSQQIIDEAACIEPDAYVELPELANLQIGDNIFPYLEAPAQKALVKALEASPSKTLVITSMLRTVAQQYLLRRWWAKGTCGIAAAALPGNSNHETGLALDTSSWASWKTELGKVGFKWFGSGDKPHYDYVGAGAKSFKGVDVRAFQRLWNRNHPDDLISEDGDYGPQTEKRLKSAPAAGFAEGASCSGDGQ